MQDPATPSPGSRRTTGGEDLLFLAFGLWTLVGLCLDGWAHRHQPQLETFFTPWHAVFYAGFTGGAACLAWIVGRGRPATTSLWAAVPLGYGPAVIGLGVFAVGGVGDGIWHTVFGVESTIDALLSPTHLLMLGGMLAGCTAPFRAAWHTAGPDAPPWPAFLAPVLSLTLATTAVAFFFLYANGFNNWPMTDTLTGAWRWELNWPPELWAGSVVMAVLAGVGLALITHPTPSPRPVGGGGRPGDVTDRAGVPVRGGARG